MKIAAVALVGLLLGAAPTLAADAVRAVMPETARPLADAFRRPNDPQHVRFCFNSAETREKIASRRLTEPFHLLRGAARHMQGEALRAKLCRWNEEYVYEVALLRRDGRIVHIYLNATNGQVVTLSNP